MAHTNNHIMAADIRSHHIKHRPYASDLEYVRVANDLQKLITTLAGGKYINKEVAKNLAIRLTLHLEDTVADAGVWRGFCTGHSRLYGRYLPFQWGEQEIPLDEVTPQSCTFIIWMTLTSYDNMRYTNPMMPALNGLGRAVFDYLDGVFDDIAINEEMLDDIYSVQVLDNFYKMRDVLSWLSDPDGCYMSYWDVTADGYSNEIDAWRNILPQKRNIKFQVSATMPFKEKGGPLAILPQEWYANMLCGHKDGSMRKYADVVSEIKFKRFDSYKLLSLDDEYLTLLGVDEAIIKAEVKGFGYDLSENAKDSNCVIGAFAYYNGCWHITGLSSFSTMIISHFDDMIKKHLDSVKNIEHEISICQKIIDKNNGRRLYYFHGFEKMKEWYADTASAKDKDNQLDKLPDHIKKSKELMIYFPSSGGIEVTEGLCAPICDDNNPFYDATISNQDSIYFLGTNALRGECIQYIISHGGLCNLSFIGGNPGVSHKMAQENLDFLARYYRRFMY